MRMRSEARTENGWESFDRMAGLVSLGLVILFLIVSVLSSGDDDEPVGPMPGALSEAVTEQDETGDPQEAGAPQAPVLAQAPQPVAPAPAPAANQAFERIPTYIDKPLQAGSAVAEPAGQNQAARDAALVVPILDLRAVDGKLTIDGIVGSDQTRKAIVRAALERFGMRNITDRVAVSAGIGSFSWTSDPKNIMVLIGRPEQATSVRIDGRIITLSGTLSDRADKEARGLAAQQLFGPTATIDNRIRVVSANGPAPVAQVDAQGAGRIDVQTSEPLSAAVATGAAPAAGTYDPAQGEPLEDGNTVLEAVVPTSVSSSQCARIATGLVIPFRSGRAELTADGRAALEAVAECLERRRYIVGGHTDSRGDADGNLVLSQARADAVVAFLVEKGVSPGQLIARGYGETRPVDTNRNEKGRARNRRIDFRFAN